jgi:hypothetical protein
MLKGFRFRVSGAMDEIGMSSDQNGEISNYKSRNTLAL